MKKILWWLILFGIILKLITYLFINRSYFLRKFDPVFFSDLYSKSQYVLGPASKGGIGDDGLYAFAGYYYLFQKGDVSAVNFEHPPLGKYLIGFSIFFFRNENMINIIYFIFLLFLTYRIGKLIIGNNLLSLVSVLILSLDSLFLDHLVRSQLDLSFTLFFIAAIYFFLGGLKRPSLLYLSFLFWGVAFATKFFPLMAVIYGFLFLLIFFYRHRYLKTFFLASLLIPAVYLIAHISFFIYHPSIILFLRHKKWMLAWWTGTPVFIGNIWRNIITGKYTDSTNILVINKHWLPTIPVIIFLAVIRFCWSIFQKKQINLLVVYGIIIIYLLYLTFLTGGIHKFLMPIYPLLIILAISNFTLLYSIISPCKK